MALPHSEGQASPTSTAEITAIMQLLGEHAARVGSVTSGIERMILRRIALLSAAAFIGSLLGIVGLVAIEQLRSNRLEQWSVVAFSIGALTFVAGAALLYQTTSQRVIVMREELTRDVDRLQRLIQLVSQIEEHKEASALEKFMLDFRLAEADTIIGHARRVMRRRFGLAFFAPENFRSGSN